MNVKVTLCKPALGYAFAAGTTDGPGAFDFTQGATSGNEFWDMVSSAVQEPTEEQIKCHSPKPILLDTGDVNMFIYTTHTSHIHTHLKQPVKFCSDSDSRGFDALLFFFFFNNNKKKTYGYQSFPLCVTGLWYR